MNPIKIIKVLWGHPLWKFLAFCIIFLGSLLTIIFSIAYFRPKFDPTKYHSGDIYKIVPQDWSYRHKSHYHTVHAQRVIYKDGWFVVYCDNTIYKEGRMENSRFYDINGNAYYRFIE